jgi:hypothetical protein
MKFVQYLAAIAIITFGMSITAFARSSNSGSFTLSESARLGSTVLQPGNYKAEWTGPANNLKVEIIKNGKTVATADASMKNLSQPSPYTAVVTKTLANNTKAVNEIEFNHRSQALIFPGV